MVCGNMITVRYLHQAVRIRVKRSFPGIDDEQGRYCQECGLTSACSRQRGR